MVTQRKEPPATATPVPGTERDVPAQFAQCLNCTTTVYRFGTDGGWSHRASHRVECARLNVSLSGIRAQQGKDQ